MKSAVIIVAASLLALAGIASAQLSQEQAERAVETRQSVLHLMAWNMAPLGAMARGRMEFDGARVATNAPRLAALTEMLADAFAVDTSANSVETEALDRIWEQPDAFAAKVQAAVDAAGRLVAVSAGGDENAMREAIAGMGSSCGSCHDDFRRDD